MAQIYKLKLNETGVRKYNSESTEHTCINYQLPSIMTLPILPFMMWLLVIQPAVHNSPVPQKAKIRTRKIDFTDANIQKHHFPGDVDLDNTKLGSTIIQNSANHMTSPSVTSASGNRYGNLTVGVTDPNVKTDDVANPSDRRRENSRISGTHDSKNSFGHSKNQRHFPVQEHSSNTNHRQSYRSRCQNLNSEQSKVCRLVIQADSKLINLKDEVCALTEMVPLPTNKSCEEYFLTSKKMRGNYTQITDQFSNIMTRVRRAATEVCLLDNSPMTEMSNISGCCQSISKTQTDISDFAKWFYLNIIHKLTPSSQPSSQPPVCIQGNLHYMGLLLRVLETVNITKQLINTLISSEFLLHV